MARTGADEIVVPPSLAGERLDRAIAALAPAVSRGEARRLIAAGVVFVDGKRTGIQSRVVRAGERISWQTPARAPVAQGAIEPRIVVERPELWIIDKPAGMPVEATREGTHGTLDDWLSRDHGAAFVTHRLDVATSGLIVVARDRPAQAELNRLFAAHAVTRRYLAVVAPAPPWTDLTIDQALDDRVAVTHVTVVARSAAAAALVVRLETGRTRQIRRHLGGVGFPVVGETVTGARTAARLLLHAFELVVPWPGLGPDGAPVEMTATTAEQITAQIKTIAAIDPPPADFLTPSQALGLDPDVLDARTRDGWRATRDG